MSSLAEIQEAITALPEDERNALTAWLNSQSAPDLDPADEEELLKSLDEAIQELDQGKGTSIAEARKLVRTWAGK